MNTRSLKSILYNLVGTDAYKALQLLAEEMQRRWKETSVISDSEWGTLQKSLEKEYKSRGLKEFFDEINRIIEND